MQDIPVEEYLKQILAAVKAQDTIAEYVLPIAGIVMAAVVGVAAWCLSRAANNLSQQANEIAEESSAVAKQALDMQRRTERRLLANAVLAHYESRADDVRSGQNYNMPHWDHEMRAAAEEIDEPNSSKLIEWLLAAIERSFEQDANDRALNALWLNSQLRRECSRWVSNPEEFDPKPVIFWADHKLKPE